MDLRGEPANTTLLEQLTPNCILNPQVSVALVPIRRLFSQETETIAENHGWSKSSHNKYTYHTAPVPFKAQGASKKTGKKDCKSQGPGNLL